MIKFRSDQSYEGTVMEKPDGRRRRWLHCFVFLGLCCLACGGFAWGQGPDDLEPLRWGADCDGGVPYVMKDPDHPDQVIGVEADLVKALERQLGRRIQFVQYEFDSLIAGVQRGDLDFAMNGLEITPENLAKVAFTKPYYLYQLQLVVKAGETRFQTIEEAREQELTIGTLEGSAAERLLDHLKVPKLGY